MKNKISKLILLITPLYASAQDTCELFKKINDDFFNGKYAHVLFIEKMEALNIDHYSLFKNSFEKYVDNSNLQAIYSKSQSTKESRLLNKKCLSENIKATKENLKLAENDNKPYFVMDSIMQDSIASYIKKIEKIKNHKLRDSLYNQFMDTKKITEFRNHSNYITTRIVSVSVPVIYGPYALLEITIATQKGEPTGRLALYKLENKQWKLKASSQRY